MGECEYCHGNHGENLHGSDGVIYNKEDDKHYLYIEHFRNEKYYIDVNYCPRCGRKLSIDCD